MWQNYGHESVAPLFGATRYNSMDDEAHRNLPKPNCNAAWCCQTKDLLRSLVRLSFASLVPLSQCLLRKMQDVKMTNQLAITCKHSYSRLYSRAFQFGQKSFDSIRFGNLINLPLVHWYSNSKLGVIFIVNDEPWAHEPMSQLIEYRLFDEQTMSRVVSAIGKSTYSMSPRGPSPRSRGHLFKGLLLHIQFSDWLIITSIW